MKLVSGLYNFLKNPKDYEKEEAKFLPVFKEFVIYDFIITFSWAFVTTILSLMFDDFALIFKSKKNLDITNSSIFFIGVFIAPIIEELAYRFSLRINRITVSVSLSIQFIIYLHLFRLIDVNFYVRIILMAIFSILMYFSFSKKLSDYLNKKFNTYLYFNLLVFSFLHAANFSYFEVFHYLFIPILISLQFFFGLYLSYVRLRQNFLYVVGFHIIHNAFILSLGLLLKL